jgi:hypothetical protein
MVLVGLELGSKLPGAEGKGKGEVESSDKIVLKDDMSQDYGIAMGFPGMFRESK